MPRSCLAYLYYYNTWLKRDQDYPLREYAWYFWDRTICLSQEIMEDRLRRKAVRLYKLIYHPKLEMHDLILATDWLPKDGLVRLKESLNIPFFYQDFDAFGGFSAGAASSHTGKEPHHRDIYDHPRYFSLEEASQIRLPTPLPCLDEETEIR
ncbi:hypothetical protein OEA41_005427 [Lepraria neglecta]|uniref:Uncharacterized protein n=1 Tax=Lepraria neglecta TaxID=209136 RepID=A0AAD9YZR8_9LECA|nr:hypothetical protein OEA41_005427 [Lepraria neglecta]